MAILCPEQRRRPRLLPRPSPCPQDGTRLNLREEDRKALTLFLALHNKGRRSMEGGRKPLRSSTLPSVGSSPSPQRPSPSCGRRPTPPTHHHAGAAERWKDALEELLAAEEALALADGQLLEGVDNVAMLLIDL